MNGLPRERAPDTPSTAGGDATARDTGGDTSGDLGWQDLADAAWLAASWQLAGRGSPRAADVPALLPDGPEALPDAVPPPSGDMAPEVPPEGIADGQEPRELVLSAVEETRTARPDTAVPTVKPPVRRVAPLRLARSLRGLGRRVPSRHRNRLDEARTAECGLSDGLWIPYLRPVRERAFDLMLLVDSAPTMPVWDSTVRRLTDEAVRSGAFRDVRTVEVALPGQGAPVLRWPGDRHADPAELLDGRGSRLFLVVTDGLARGWAGRGADELLGRLTSGGPTALVHLLPPYLRHRSSLYPFRAELDAAGFGALNRHFGCRPPLGAWDRSRRLADPDDGSVPVPVLSLRAGSFRSWADLITGERGVRRTLPVVLAGAMTKGVAAPGLRSPRIDGPRAAVAAVRKFASLASPLARQLAVLLAVAPLRFDVIEELRDRAFPESGPDHLAEIMMGGLIDWEPEGEGGPDFAEGVREALLATGNRTQLARAVGLLAESRAGQAQGIRLRAALRDPVRAALPDGGAGPAWLRIELAVLRALGGLPYRHRAARLADRLLHGEGSAAEAIRDDKEAFDVNAPALRSHPAASPGGSVSPTTPVTADKDVRRDEQSMDGTAPELRFVRTGQPKIMGNVPPKNPNFTGRESLLAAVERQLQEDETTAVLPHALHGMGGVGKSQIAVEYVYRHSAEFNVIWWIPAEQENLILGALADLARSLGLEVGPQANAAVPAVREALRTGKPFDNWLLVFDNAEDIEAVRSYFPNGGPGKIIVTSRNREWERVATPLSVDVFDRDESITLLQRRARGMSADDADRLAAALGDLPLAVEQAGAWHAATGMPVNEYLDLLEQRRPEILELDPSPDYPLPVAAVWDISLGRLSQDNPAARQLLEICACMAPEPIPLNMLRGGRNVEITPELDPVLRDPLLLARATRDLSKLSLVRLDHKSGTLQMHRLMQNVIVARLDEEERAKMTRAAHLLLTTAKPGAPASPDQWPAYQAILPHVIASGAVESSDAWVRDLVYDMVFFLYYWGAHESGAAQARLAWTAWRAQSGDEDLHVIRVTKLLGFYLRLLGRSEEAAAHNERALAISRGAQIPDEELIDSMWQMAGALRQRGEFQAACDLDEEAFTRASDLFGPEDPATLSAAHDYCVSLRAGGRFVEAREIDEETARQRELLYGPASGLTLNTLNGLAIDIRENGDYLGARALQESNHQAYVTHFGESNAATIRSALLLAVCRRRAGVVEGGAAFAEQNLERFTTRYGLNNLDALAAAIHTMVERRLNGDLAGSRELGEQALAGLRTVVGARHPHTQFAKVNLAATLRAQGDIDKAEALDIQAWQLLESTLGERHVNTLTAAMSRANNHYARLDFSRAKEADAGILARLTESVGAEHPLTLVCTANLALDQRGLGQSAEADRLNAVAIEGFSRVLGDDHPWQTAARLHQRIECDIAALPL
ncbi:FxSxx-COOH system tetratricopeptide repeat protein [Streptomyces sp. BE147]|uniref:FxSxx-COOH system tetratricopeptide repeat protein n=1 Tax=unclassified Streptomyces TaxID=2593676 RepID=UPI002E79D4B5|nr:FxSxx-COOH system tetratricopeptide repeat protein [Streptomyces sp. BE147]MEE1742159.1 FxSxx-COOH system tetratricopeptide repeat protein [Streptomyces sp. BE147]